MFELMIEIKTAVSNATDFAKNLLDRDELLTLEVLGHDSINFNHVRNLAWAADH